MAAAEGSLAEFAESYAVERCVRVLAIHTAERYQSVTTKALGYEGLENR